MSPLYWLACPLAEVPASDAWLSPRESARLRGLRVAKRRDDWRLGRWTAKHALAARLGTASDPRRLARLEILPDEHGAPLAFRDGGRLPLALSLSHRAGWGLCALAAAGCALGCDLECVEPRSDAFVRDYFTDDERQRVARARDAELACALLWSAKESALKALRTGLREDTREVAIRPGCDRGGGGWSPLRVDLRSGGELAGWWLRRGALVLTVVAGGAPAAPVAIDAARGSAPS